MAKFIGMQIFCIAVLFALSGLGFMIREVFMFQAFGSLGVFATGAAALNAVGWVYNKIKEG